MVAGGAGGGVVAACLGTTADAGATGAVCVVCATAWVVGGAAVVAVVWTGAAWTGVCDDGGGGGVVVGGGVLVAAGVGVGDSAPPVSRTAKAAAMTRPAVLRVLIRAQPRRPRICGSPEIVEGSLCCFSVEGSVFVVDR